MKFQQIIALTKDKRNTTSLRSGISKRFFKERVFLENQYENGFLYSFTYYYLKYKP